MLELWVFLVIFPTNPLRAKNKSCLIEVSAYLTSLASNCGFTSLLVDGTNLGLLYRSCAKLCYVYLYIYYIYIYMHIYIYILLASRVQIGVSMGPFVAGFIAHDCGKGRKVHPSGSTPRWCKWSGRHIFFHLSPLGFSPNCQIPWVIVVLVGMRCGCPWLKAVAKVLLTQNFHGIGTILCLGLQSYPTLPWGMSFSRTTPRRRAMFCLVPGLWLGHDMFQSLFSFRLGILKINQIM